MRKVMLITAAVCLLFILGCNVSKHYDGQQISPGDAIGSTSFKWHHKEYIISNETTFQGKQLIIDKKIGTHWYTGKICEIYSVKGHSPNSIIAINIGGKKTPIFQFAKR